MMQGGGSALLVRRKGRAMPAELGRGGQQAERIDWRQSVLLNLVVQATYCLTVATCRSVAALMSCSSSYILFGPLLATKFNLVISILALYQSCGHESLH